MVESDLTMHSDLQVSSAAPKASIFYSRYLSLNDVRDRKENNLPIFRCSSLQCLSEKEREDFSKNCGKGESLEAAVKLLNVQIENQEEDVSHTLLNSENDFSLQEKEIQKYCSESEGQPNGDEAVESETLSAKWCQCSKENSNSSSTARGLARKSHGPRKMKHVMSTLDEEVPTETRCERCRLEIHDENRKKERIIELWMQFFG